MPILSASQLTLSYGADDLFTDLSLRLDAKERVGLVGPNGSGKTSLLQILASQLEPDRGEVAIQRELSIGYLQQEAVLTFRGQDNTLYEEMLTVFSDLTDIEAELRQLEQKMEDGDFSERTLDRYGQLQTRYEGNGGYAYSAEIKLTLIGLGFPEDSWSTPLNHLSGGQKTRILLARLLLEQPDLLILDEPTNHLDLEAIEWLESTLRKWPGALVIVSHDRYFLDRVVTRVWEIASADLKAYSGDYTNYVARRQQEWDREEALFAAARARMGKELDFIRQHVADGQSDIAKGKLRRLTRDIVLLENFPPTEIEGRSWIEVGGRVRTFSANEAAQRLRKLRMISSRPPVMKVKLESAETSDRLVMQSKRLTIGYGADNLLFETGRLRIERKDRIALIGGNGSGKSTLLKTLLGFTKAIRGEVEFGDNLSFGYFAQAHDQLNPANRVIDELMQAAEIGLQQARNLLARYLFRGHAVFKKVGDLSGGERGRLALAVLATTGANFLLLDEPTNHLDIPSQEVLQSVLEQYDGTLMLVSHDRYLISRLATQIWEIRNGKLHVYEEGYAAYLEQRALDIENEKAAMQPVVEIDPAAIDDILQFQQELAADAEDSAEGNPNTWAKRLGELEDLLDVAEPRVDELQAQIEAAELFGEPDAIASLKAELASAQTHLANLLAEWDRLIE